MKKRRMSRFIRFVKPEDVGEEVIKYTKQFVGPEDYGKPGRIWIKEAIGRVLTEKDVGKDIAQYWDTGEFWITSDEDYEAEAWMHNNLRKNPKAEMRRMAERERREREREDNWKNEWNGDEEDSPI